MENNLLVSLGHIKPTYWYCDDKKIGKIPREVEEINLEQAKKENMGVYFAVNELGGVPNEHGNLRYNENVLRPLACFIDFDHGTYEEQLEKILNSPLEPSAFVKSGHGWHVYWFLKDTEKSDLPRWSNLQKALAKYFGSDPAVNDYSRIMRLPGSWHCKDEEPKLVILEKCNPSLRYSLDEMMNEFPFVPDPNLGSEVEKLLSTPTGEGGRNTAATKVIGALLNRCKITEWETIAWPMVQSWNMKMCNPPDKEYILRGTFESLSKKEIQKRSQAEQGVTVFAEGEMIPTLTTENETIIVSIPVEDGLAKFVFQNIEQTSSKEMEVLLSVEMLVPGSQPRPFTQRINLYSGTAMEGLARMLGKSFGKDLRWDLLLNTAQSSLLSYLANRDLSLDLSEISDEEAPILFAPFLVKDGANLLFGDGGTGKTMLCLRLALSLATGKEFLGYEPNDVVPTLFVDYEDNEKTASFRLSRLCADPALNLDPMIAKKLVRYLNPQGAPLHTIVPALKKIIAQHHIGLILVDSVASACGAEPEKAEAASRYYNALKSLNITSLSIAHVVKTEGNKQDKAFGSVFWHNLARNTWNVQGEEDPEEPINTLLGIAGEKSKQLGMFHRKFNSGPKSKPINLKIVYGEKNVRFEEGKSGYWNKDKKVEERIIASLSSRGGRTKGDLFEDLVDIPDKTLRNVLAILKQKGVIEKEDGWKGKYYLKSASGQV